MPEMKTIIENDDVVVKSTGRDYDFIATVENKTSEPLVVVPTHDDFDTYFEPFVVPANDWVGVDANDDGVCFMNAMDEGSIRFGGEELAEEYDLGDLYQEMAARCGEER